MARTVVGADEAATVLRKLPGHLTPAIEEALYRIAREVGQGAQADLRGHPWYPNVGARIAGTMDVHQTATGVEWTVGATTPLSGGLPLSNAAGIWMFGTGRGPSQRQLPGRPSGDGWYLLDDLTTIEEEWLEHTGWAEDAIDEGLAKEGI